MNLIILGPQGSGKGTQAKLLAEKFGLENISTGQLLRNEAQSGSEKGKIIAEILETGKLVPSETAEAVIEPVILGSKSGFILDGSPRNIEEAEHLDQFLNENNIKIDKVILLNIPREESLTRLTKRAKIENRADDTPEAINERLSIYENDTLPVIDSFRSRGNLLIIDGTPDIQTIFQDIIAKLENK